MKESTLRRIEKAIKEIYHEDPENFKYSASAISRHSNISRPTLIAARDQIELIIKKLPKPRDIVLQNREIGKIEYDKLKLRHDILQAQNRAILSQFSDLFSKIYGESIDVRHLINQKAPDSDDESED